MPRRFVATAALLVLPSLSFQFVSRTTHHVRNRQHQTTLFLADLKSRPKTIPSDAKKEEEGSMATATTLPTNETRTTFHNDTNNTQFSASESFGSLLMQMQNKKEGIEQDVVNLDESSKSLLAVGNETTKATTSSRGTEKQEDDSMLTTVNLETARELDTSVRILSGNEKDFVKNLQVQSLPPLYEAFLQSEQGATKISNNSTMDRIDRDMRMLALKIVASTETAEQWKVFFKENEGLFPILETIREGARSIHFQTEDPAVGQPQEQTFRAACSACRAVRDLCAISPEVAAVVTDTVLRANAAWDGGLMDDFCTMLRYAYANEHSSQDIEKDRLNERGIRRRRNQREIRLRCKLYVGQLLLAMAVASDDAIESIRSTKGLTNAIVACSSFARIQRTRRWLRYPGEMAKWLWRSRNYRYAGRRPFLEANTIADDLNGSVQRTSNQILASIGYNRWIPKTPGQRGLRILALDGGGSRGMVAVTAVRCLMEKLGAGCEPADSFDIIAGTSTGGIIAFLTGLKQETSAEAVERYNQLIKQIFVKSALSTPLMLFTTASYDESHFMGILSNILKDDTMLDSRSDPTGPLVFAVASKMSSTPTHISLFRNYNYGSGELADSFTINPDKAREDLGLSLEQEHPLIRKSSYERKRPSTGSPGVRMTNGSRHPGSFRVLQRFALRASTAAPTVFKPVMMGGEIYADGGIVSSNPSAVALHEARTLFPDIPIEMLVSIGTGGFVEQKSAPKIGWDGIIGQIVNSATDGEQVHHILEDILGDTAVLGRHKKSAISQTKYYRFNPVLGLPDDFPIDVTDPDKLARLRQIARAYMDEPEQQQKIEEIADMILCRHRWGKRVRNLFRRR